MQALCGETNVLFYKSPRKTGPYLVQDTTTPTVDLIPLYPNEIRIGISPAWGLQYRSALHIAHELGHMLKQQSLLAATVPKRWEMYAHFHYPLATRP